MRVRILVSLSMILLALPLLASDPQARTLTEPIGVLHLDGSPLEVFSWSWGATQIFDRTGGGGGAGKVELQDFHFSKKVDKSSPALFQACASGRHFPTATFIARKSGKGQQELMVVKFTDLLVSSYQTGGSSGDAMPTESISLNYASVEIEVP
jgi:type VI secretion system secreted protein Hcp